MATLAGLLTERFAIVTAIGEVGNILQPKGRPRQNLSSTSTLTLLALIRAYDDFPVLTADNSLLLNGGFAPASWMADQIERLTRDTRSLFNPSPDDLRVAIRRLKHRLARVVSRLDLVESSQGLGYRFRVWPSLITVAVVAPS